MSSHFSYMKEKEKENFQYPDINNRNIQTKPLFNSKLYLYIDINQEESDEINENNTKEDSDNSYEFDEINYLSNELIKDLDNSSNLEETENVFMPNIKKEENLVKNNSVINSLISLAKNGYEFKPKNFKSETKNEKTVKENNLKKKKYMNNKFNNNKYLKRKSNENDWICPLCNNLNFSFRTICNKCKISKKSI